MEVSTEEEFSTVSSDETIHLTADIKLQDTFSTISEFSGMIDGNGYTIYNLQDIFIEEVCEEAVVKNVTFKDIQIECDSRDKFGLFVENKGVLKDVTIKDSTCEVNCSDQGFLTAVNKGIIRNCTVVDSVIIGEYNTGIIVGICSDEGRIEDCICKNSMLKCLGKSELDSQEYKLGGIVSQLKSSIVTNCEVENVEMDGLGISGLVVGSAGRSSVVEKNTVTNSEIDCSFSSGIAGMVKHSSVTECKVFNSKLTGMRRTSGIVSETISSVIRNSYIKESTLNVIKPNMPVGSILGNTGDMEDKKTEVVDCFSECITIQGQAVNRFTKDCLYKNCYFDEVIFTERIQKQPVSDSKRFYCDIEYTTSVETSGAVKVSESSDLEDAMPQNKIVLTDDITITSSSSLFDIFYGTFDGNGHTIWGVSESLFKLVTSDAVVKNVTIPDAGLCLTDRYNAVVSKINKGTIKNITIEDTDIDIETVGKVGLVTGINKSKGLIQNCTISADISSINCTVGGIAGETLGRIINCTVSATILANNTSGFISGKQGKVEDESTIKNCEVSGVLKGKEKVGGIVGESTSLYSSFQSIKNCKVDIQVEGEYGVGGIAGKASNCILTNCEVIGDIRGDNEVGGVSGYFSRGKLEDCTSTGSIYGEERVGGIVGKNESSIKSCINNSTVKGVKNIGGLVGLNDHSVVSCSINTGSIKGTESVGGLIGKLKTDPVKDIDLKKCYNKSDVVFDNSGGVIIGQTDPDIDIVNCESIFWKNVSDSHITSKIGKNTNISDKEIRMIINI